MVSQYFSILHTVVSIHLTLKEYILNWLVQFSKQNIMSFLALTWHSPGRIAQSVGHLTLKSGVLGSIPGLATYFRFSIRFFKKGSCQLLAKVCARSTG